MANILFRADSSYLIGTGHIMRDLVLASQYKNDNIIFATQDLEGSIHHKIQENNYKVELLNTNNINEVITLIHKYNITLIIIDHYGIDYKYEKELKRLTPIKIFCLDDTYEEHFCDILLNHNINAKKKKYINLVPPHCEIRCGSKYTLLRDEFLIEKKKEKHYKKQVTVFISIGGADHSNINIEILKTMKKLKDINVIIVTTQANKNLISLQKYSKQKKWIQLYINSNNIAKLMNQSHFAIITPSVTANEILYMDIPFIAIKTAQNQNEIYKYLKKKKFSTLKKFNKENLIKKMKKLIKKI